MGSRITGISSKRYHWWVPVSQGYLPRDTIGGFPYHRDIFQEIPLVGFRNAKSLKNYLVRAKLPKEKVSLGCSTDEDH